MSWNPLRWFAPGKQVKTNQVQEENEQEPAIILNYEQDFKQVTASYLDYLIGDVLYENTLSMLDEIANLKPAQVSFIANDYEQGILVDGKKRGWHRKWLNDSQTVLYYGWFFVFYGENEKERGPWYFYSQSGDDVVVEYYPSQDMWIVYNKDNAIKMVAKMSVSVPGDYIYWHVDVRGIVERVEQKENGEVILDAGYDGCGRLVKIVCNKGNLVQIGDVAPTVANITEVLNY